MRKLSFPIGHQFGKLQLVAYIESDKSGTHCTFKCECGTAVNRPLRYVSHIVKKGFSPCCIECGKISKSNNGKKRRIHGLSVTNRKLYDVHAQMMRRCYNPESTDFPNYGGRGITVCEEWQDVVVFVQWALSTGYHESVTIERIDVNVAYCPENCTWIDNSKQAHNTRIVHRLTVDGVTKVISEWAKECGISKHTIKRRIQMGWDHESAVKTPAYIGSNQFGIRP